MQGMYWCGCIASSTVERLKCNPGRSFSVNRPWVWRYFRINTEQLLKKSQWRESFHSSRHFMLFLNSHKVISENTSWQLSHRLTLPLWIYVPYLMEQAPLLKMNVISSRFTFSSARFKCTWHPQADQGHEDIMEEHRWSSWMFPTSKSHPIKSGIRTRDTVRRCQHTDLEQSDKCHVRRSHLTPG